MMKDLIARSRSLEETAQNKKGLIWILEILVFGAVFIVATIAQTLVMGPIQMVVMFTDKSYLAAMQTGDVEKAA